MKPSVPYEEGLDRDLEDPEFAAAYLTASFDEGPEVFLVAVADVVRARGGFTKLSRETNRARPGLHRAFSGNTRPEFETVLTVLRSLNLKMAITPA